MVRDGAASGWALPVRGVLTQPFGATSFELEPPGTYKGVSYPHFHGAIDIAAPLGTPVTAASDGVVAFVGHLPDGAMIVLVAHPGGYVSEYAHLDDTFLLPSVKVGQSVRAARWSASSTYGITTARTALRGLKDGAPVDPLSLAPETRRGRLRIERRRPPSTLRASLGYATRKPCGSTAFAQRRAEARRTRSRPRPRRPLHSEDGEPAHSPTALSGP